MKAAKQDTPLQPDPKQVFVFVGEGLGVPGLPHRLTMAEAEQLGVHELLIGAIQNGNYKPEVSDGN